MEAILDVAEAPARAPGRGLAIRRPALRVYAITAVLFGLSVLLGLTVGRGTPSDAATASLFLTMRAQRLTVALCSGAALASAGVAVQALFNNPLASPWALGTTAGAGLGAHVALLVSVLGLGGGGLLGVLPEMLVPLGAVLGALGSLLALLSITRLRAGTLTLLLTGLALMTLLQGASSFLTHAVQEAWELNRAVAQLQSGNLASAGPRQVWLALIMAVGGALPLLGQAGTLDVLLSGEEEAATLGVELGRTRLWLITWVAVSTAGAVAVGGNVSMVGLIVPHALRPFVGQRHRYLLPFSFVVGGAFVALCDVACRLLPTRFELPLGVLVELVGAPVFLRLMMRLTRAELGHG